MTRPGIKGGIKGALAGALIVTLAASGCATSSDVSAARSEASEALRVANEATLADLDDAIGLDARAARNIDALRLGRDGKPQQDFCLPPDRSGC